MFAITYEFIYVTGYLEDMDTNTNLPKLKVKSVNETIEILDLKIAPCKGYLTKAQHLKKIKERQVQKTMTDESVHNYCAGFEEFLIYIIPLNEKEAQTQETRILVRQEIIAFIKIFVSVISGSLRNNPPCFCFNFYKNIKYCLIFSK